MDELCQGLLQRDEELTVRLVLFDGGTLAPIPACWKRCSPDDHGTFHRHGFNEPGASSGTKHPSLSYRASDGYELHYRRWKTDLPQPRAMIVGVHGIQSHGGWYAYSCSRLAEAGYDVSFLDRRGSGLNTDRRGFAVHEDRLVNDVAQFLSGLRDQQQTAGYRCPIVLMGVSWGGKLAALVGCRRPDLVDGLALLYPGLYSQVKPTWHQRFKLWMAVQREWGRFHIPIPLNEPELFTDEPHWRDSFVKTNSHCTR